MREVLGGPVPSLSGSASIASGTAAGKRLLPSVFSSRLTIYGSRNVPHHPANHTIGPTYAAIGAGPRCANRRDVPVDLEEVRS